MILFQVQSSDRKKEREREKEKEEKELRRKTHPTGSGVFVSEFLCFFLSVFFVLCWLCARTERKTHQAARAQLTASSSLPAVNQQICALSRLLLLLLLLLMVIALFRFCKQASGARWPPPAAESESASGREREKERE